MESIETDRVAVFGAGGFVGSHLTKCLIQNGYSEVSCYDLTEEKLGKIVPGGGYKFQRLDIRTEDEAMAEAIHDGDMVIDLVAHANPIIYRERPLEVVEHNLFDNLKIVDGCIKQHKLLVQLSACEVYAKNGAFRSH